MAGNAISPVSRMIAKKNACKTGVFFGILAWTGS
jgi:hypothetical protein